MTESRREQWMRVLPVPADGDCFYHCFILGLSIDAEPQDLRRLVAARVEASPELFADIIEDWKSQKLLPDDATLTDTWLQHVLQRILDEKEWATTTVIHVLSDAFNVRTIVY